MSQYQPPQSPYPQQDYGPPQPLQPLLPQQQWQQPPSQPLPPQEQWQTPPQWQQPIYQQPPQQPIYQQPPQKPRKSRKRLWAIIGVVVLAIIVIAAIASQGGKSTPSANNTQATQPATTQQQPTQAATAQQQPTQPTTTSHTVGAPVVVSGTWTVTVNSIKTSAGDDITAPKSGDTFIIVDVTLKNTSSSNQNVSSLGMFNFKDSTGQQYTETITDFAKAPDGTIAPGELLRGQLVYEVPTSQHSFTFSFQSDLMGSDLTEWNLSI